MVITEPDIIYRATGNEDWGTQKEMVKFGF